MPIEILRIATNLNRFSKVGNHYKFHPTDIRSDDKKLNLVSNDGKASIHNISLNCDFVFTGSYHNQPRSMMTLNPNIGILATAPNNQLNGLLVGKGRKNRK